MFDEDKTRQQLASLEEEHRALDVMLRKADSSVGQLKVQRLKKRKLWLKDEIASLNMQLYPDIIA